MKSDVISVIMPQTHKNRPAVLQTPRAMVSPKRGRLRHADFSILAGRPLISGRLLVNVMSYPYRILTGKIKANAQDLETWVRHCLDKYFVAVERVDLDETKRRFLLRFRQKILLIGEEPIKIIWGGAELIEWHNNITEIMGMWPRSPQEWETKSLKKKSTDVIYEERLTRLQELGNKIVEKFGVLEETNRSTAENELGAYTVGDLLEFEKDKTPKSWFIFVSCLAYLQNPDERGAIGLMRRAFKALIETKEEINKWKQLFPNNTGVADLVQSFNRSYPMSADDKVPEQQVMRSVSLALVEDYKRAYKDPKAMLKDSKQFFNNSELIPEEKRAFLEQIRTMKIGDASALIAAQSLFEKWKMIMLQTKLNLKPNLFVTEAVL